MTDNDIEKHCFVVLNVKLQVTLKFKTLLINVGDF